MRDLLTIIFVALIIGANCKSDVDENTSTSIDERAADNDDNSLMILVDNIVRTTIDFISSLLPAMKKDKELAFDTIEALKYMLRAISPRSFIQHVVLMLRANGQCLTESIIRVSGPMRNVFDKPLSSIQDSFTVVKSIVQNAPETFNTNYHTFRDIITPLIDATIDIFECSTMVISGFYDNYNNLEAVPFKPFLKLLKSGQYLSFWALNSVDMITKCFRDMATFYENPSPMMMQIRMCVSRLKKKLRELTSTYGDIIATMENKMKLSQNQNYDSIFKEANCTDLTERFRIRDIVQANDMIYAKREITVEMLRMIREQSIKVEAQATRYFPGS